MKHSLGIQKKQVVLDTPCILMTIFHKVRQVRCVLQCKTALLAFGLLPPFCTEAGNAKIAAIVKTFEGRSIYSDCSFWPTLGLPKEASSSQVCDALLHSGFVQCTFYSVITNETVLMVLDHVPVDANGKPRWTPLKKPITATLLQTDGGDKVVFMDFKEGGWRTSVCNIPTEILHAPVQVGVATNAFPACTNKATYYLSIWAFSAGGKYLPKR